MVILVMASALLAWRLATARPTADLPPVGQSIRVSRVIDGDTIELEGGFRIRLLGVNTPETKHPDRPPEPWGLAAENYTRSRVEGREISLEFDQERLDQYRRILAYVYTADGAMLNEEMIRQGLSPAVTSFPIRSDRKRLFTNAEAAAKSAQRGIWSGTASPEATLTKP